MELPLKKEMDLEKLIYLLRKEIDEFKIELSENWKGIPSEEFNYFEVEFNKILDNYTDYKLKISQKSNNNDVVFEIDDLRKCLKKIKEELEEENKIINKKISCITSGFWSYVIIFGAIIVYFSGIF